MHSCAQGLGTPVQWRLALDKSLARADHTKVYLPVIILAWLSEVLASGRCLDRIVSTEWHHTNFQPHQLKPSMLDIHTIEYKTERI